MTKKAKYPTRESVMAALEARTTAGKENYPSALDPEDISLYVAARRFGVELPKKERCWRKSITTELKTDICPICDKGPRSLPYCNPDDKKQNICHVCYVRIRRYRAKGISGSMPEPKVKKEKKTEGRKIKYPDKEAVEAALKARVEAGKENYASVIAVEDMTLYRKAKEFGVSLLKKEIQRRALAVPRTTRRPKRVDRTPVAVLPPVPVEVTEKIEQEEQIELEPAIKSEPKAELAYPEYCLGDKVKNQTDPGLYDKIGEVVEVGRKEVRVKFTEYGIEGKPVRVTRVYIVGFNLHHIVLCDDKVKRLIGKEVVKR